MDITKSSGYRDFVWAVNLHRLGFEITGLWPKPNKCTKKNLWPEMQVGIVYILLIFVSNIPPIYTIIQVWSNMVLVIDNLQTTLPQLITLVKFIIIRQKQTVLSSILNMMAEDWMAFKLGRERDVMIKRAQTARLIMMIGYGFVIIGSLTVIILPFFGIPVAQKTNFTVRHKLLPLETYYFYDTDKSPQYELTYFIHIITILAVVIYMSVDIFLMLIILHICGQLENFKCRLVSFVACKNFNKILKNIIATHLRLMRFADNIENTYSLMMLILIFHFGVVFCLTGFLFTLILTEKKVDKTVIAQGYFSIFLFIVFLMNTFLYCAAGELVTEQCNAVYRAMCDLEWYKLESRKARNLIMLMIRSYQPFRLTAGKIIPLTMATFCNILKTSSGYISFLVTKHG